MIAARVLNALLRENYGDLARRVSRDKHGVSVTLAGGRAVRLAPGRLFQDFVVAPGERLELPEVLETLEAVADPADADGVAAFRQECAEAELAWALLQEHRDTILPRLADGSLISLESLAAFADHPVYPTSRARGGLTAEELLAYAPEFAPSFELRWAAVRAAERHDLPAWWPEFGQVGLAPMPGHTLFPVHPLSLAQVAALDGVTVAPRPHLRVRPTLSMRTVEVEPRTHLKLPLATSTLGRRNRRSIKPGTLDDGARAQRLLERMADPRVLVADEQTYGHAGHEYLAWMVRKLPGQGQIVPVAAFHAIDLPVEELLSYLEILIGWNVRLFVEYGVALEAHQQNLAIVRSPDGPRLLVKDNDGLLASPSRLAARGIEAPAFSDERMLTDDPHALADVFVTITLHLAAAAVLVGRLPDDSATGLLRQVLDDALRPYGNDPMARILRARTLEAARLTGKSMVIAGTLVAKERTGARDVNKYYGTSGPNYLRAPSMLRSA
ncbi:IucA/IucC family protein [Nonomuraea sp. NPDC050663]|uniref:IucA/IucC family protein n=1 Tax=Nonomuraea sp. NPDC050663 TaxID=3364370 RepID=UPI0037B78A80